MDKKVQDIWKNVKWIEDYKIIHNKWYIMSKLNFQILVNSIKISIYRPDFLRKIKNSSYLKINNNSLKKSYQNQQF